MGAYLDLDDAVCGHPKAQEELKVLRNIAADAEDGAAALSEALGKVARLKAELTALREGAEAAISDWDAYEIPARVIVRLRALLTGGSDEPS